MQHILNSNVKFGAYLKEILYLIFSRNSIVEVFGHSFYINYFLLSKQYSPDRYDLDEIMNIYRK